MDPLSYIKPLKTGIVSKKNLKEALDSVSDPAINSEGCFDRKRRGQGVPNTESGCDI